MYAESGAEQALRMSDKSRGVYQGMLTRGYATDVIDGVDSLIHTVPLELVDANGNLTGETGGLIQILAPLFSNTEVILSTSSCHFIIDEYISFIPIKLPNWLS